MAMSFTKDQQKAIDEYGKNIIVSAGAGSGKTAVLSERVLHFVKDKGFKLDEFLILTFTKLAAGEMKDRIRKKLQKNGLEEAKNVDTSDICNFDSYSFSLLKKYHFKLGLSKDVSIVDNDIMKLKKIEILDRIMNEYYSSCNEDFEKMISRFSFKDDSVCRKIILNIEEAASSCDDTEEFFSTFMDKYYSKNKIEEMEKEMNDLIFSSKSNIEYLLGRVPAVKYQKSKKEDLHEFCYNAIKYYLESKTYDEAYLAITSFTSTIRGATLLTPDEKESFKEFKDYCEELKEEVMLFPSSREEIKSLIEENIPYVSIMLSIAKKINEEQNAYKKEKQVFEFNDIAKMVLKLIRTDEEVKSSIKNKLKMIMIDEYQDTSSIQEAFIKELENDNVYMVGDIKQSIYRFRKAESSIFQNKYNAYKDGNNGIKIDLNKNFRSRKEVLEDFNLIFSNIMKEDIGGADYAKDHLIEYGNLDYLKAGDPLHSCHSQIISYYSNDEKRKFKNEERRSFEAKIIANDIIKKIKEGYLVYQFGENDTSSTRPCRFSDFCILMDRGSAFEDYKRVFNEYKIPLFCEQDENIVENALVLVLKNLIKMIVCIQKGDYTSSTFIHAFLSLARSFIFEYSDEKIYKISKNNSFYNDEIVTSIKDVIFNNKGISQYELLLKIIFSLEIYNKIILLGNIESNEKYLDSFIQKFESMVKLDYDFEGFIEYLENINEFGMKFTISSSGTEKESVRMMNIHKSKGLEFPIVYFPGLYPEFNTSDYSSPFGISSNYGICFDCEEGKKLHPSFILNKEYERKQDLSEKIRLFYVSLTRTREKMIFVMEKSDKVPLIEKAKSFYDIFNRFKDESSFEKEDIDVDSLEDESPLNKKGNDIEFVPLTIKNLELKKEEIEIHKSSKELKLGSSRRTLEFGTKLHFILEIMDLKNPDYSLIKDDKTKNIISSFLNSSLMENIKEGEIYKEYEFYDKDNLNQGIIDLMIIYKDHIDIIDYKTKNILDEEYDKQLKSYENYIYKKLNKKVNTYLYSLMEGNYRKTN